MKNFFQKGLQSEKRCDIIKKLICTIRPVALLSGAERRAAIGIWAVTVVKRPRSPVNFDTGRRIAMPKEGIHPKYEKTTITCACGNVIETSSTKQNIKVEICSKCHPFFTGKQKLVDTGGRVDRFNRRYGINNDKK